MRSPRTKLGIPNSASVMPLPTLTDEILLPLAVRSTLYSILTIEFDYIWLLVAQALRSTVAQIAKKF